MMTIFAGMLLCFGLGILFTLEIQRLISDINKDRKGPKI